MQIAWCCFSKPTTWRVIRNFEGGGGGGLKDQTFKKRVKSSTGIPDWWGSGKIILCGGSKDNTYIARGRYHTQFPTVLSHCSNETYVHHSQWWIQGRGPGGSLPAYFKTKRKGWIIFLETRRLPPPLSKALGDPPPSPPPTLSQGLNPALVVTQSHGTCILFFLVYKKWILLGLNTCAIHPFYTLGSYCNRNLKGSTGIIVCTNTVIRLYLWIGRSELARLTCKILREALVLIPTLRTNIWLQICEPDLQNIRLLLCAYM